MRLQCPVELLYQHPRPAQSQNHLGLGRLLTSVEPQMHFLHPSPALDRIFY